MDVFRNRTGRLRRAQAAGYCLLEVLITLFVTSIGLLGLAVLQIQSLRSSHSALMYTQAVSYAGEMVEQLHARMLALPAAAAVCQGDPCVSAGIADAALQEWQARINDSLPNGNGSLSLDAESASVAVDWDDHGESRQFRVSLAL